MTQDVIALTPRQPQLSTFLASLFAAGPDARMDTTPDGALIQLCDADGRPLASIESPLLLQVPGEAERLLGPKAAGTDVPVWWTETRATTATPNGPALAGAFATRLTAQLGGTVWPPEAAAETPGAVLDLNGDVAAVPAPAAAQPAVDVLTDKAGVVIQDRPLIAMTSWLADALRACTDTERALQIVTPSTSRLSQVTRRALAAPPHTWVVQNPDGGYYNGLSGARLHWKDGIFERVTPGPSKVVAAFAEPEVPPERQLTLNIRTRHQPTGHLQLGGGLEAAWQALTGRSPAGWNTAEPVTQPWSRTHLTTLVRDRAPRPTLLVAVGHPDRPAQATTRITRTTKGVEEEITLTLGYAPEEPLPLGVLLTLADTLTTDHGLVTALVQHQHAPRDLTVGSHRQDTPHPLAFALGPNDVADIGVTHARRPPLPDRPRQLGPSARPAFYYPLAEGPASDAEAKTDAWQAFDTLMQHLRDPARARVEER